MKSKRRMLAKALTPAENYIYATFACGRTNNRQLASGKRGYDMKKFMTLFLTLAICAAGCGNAAVAAETDAKIALLRDAYSYLFPLVLTDVTKEYCTNTEKVTDTAAPVNQFVHTSRLCTSNDKFVVTPNVDTIYSQAWLDLSKGDLVLHLPKTDRFYTVQLLDAWTDTQAVLKDSGDYLITRNAKAAAPKGAKKITVDTNTVWLITRTLIYNAEDMPNVKAIQQQMKLVPVEYFVSGKEYLPPEGKYDPAKNLVPIDHVLKMTPQEFFTRANKLLENNPARKEDAEHIKPFEKMGIGAGLKFDEKAAGGNLAAAWKKIVSNLGEDLTKRSSKYFVMMGNWHYFGKPVGEFGTAYDYRAYIALYGLGANPVRVAIYPFLETSADGKLLNGNRDYTLHFDSLPPVCKGGFWSVTVYGDDNFLIANPINRYAINDRSDFKLNADGSLDVRLGAKKPSDKTFWLPTGDKGFHLVLRIYLPDMAKIEGWKAPEAKTVK